MPAELMVIGFDGKHRAAEVLNQLESLEASWAIDLKDAVAAYRSTDGRLHVDRGIQPTTREAAAWGAIIGGLIGALVMAPITAGAAYWKDTTGISDAFVKQVGGMVLPGQSAVFVLARASDPAKVEEQFRGYGGKVLRTTLSKDAAAKFQELMNPLTAAAR